ncbi:hypothetical protein K0M31_001514 [Melipona bicolor]|uniref:Uncharacterized protein n=1 Tax=Melipona bicolor TaxID=60889 RepID=A0AA40KXU7_9HYME|nr:hypothetical protein K0M31_001514 [Melipona bicolor]
MNPIEHIWRGICLGDPVVAQECIHDATKARCLDTEEWRGIPRREDGPSGIVPSPLAPQQTLLVLGVSPFGDAGTGGESVNRVATDRAPCRRRRTHQERDSSPCRSR